MARLRRLLLTPFLAALLALPLILLSPGSAAGATDRLPDIGMAHLRDLRITTTSSGQKQLRFSTIIVNVGSGRFEVRGTRASGSSTMTLKQRIYNDAGGYRTVSTSAVAYFAGDGHSHWHVRNLETYTLTRLDNGNSAGTGVKAGFCFYDNWRYGSTLSPYYTKAKGACGTSSTNTSMFMGLSRRWGDEYHYTIPDQYINITGLASGNYRLRATADAQNWFAESNNTNNSTWVDLQISGTSLTVLKQGPQA
jgi:hypothetical protein